MNFKLFKYWLLRCSLLAVVFLTAAPTGYSQTTAQLVKAGDKKYEEGDYYAAALYYKDALKKDAENPDLNFKYAEASRMFNDYASAAEGYKNVIKYDKTNQYPFALLWAGDMLRSSCECKTEEAMKLYKRFRAKYRKKDYYSAKCQQSLEACSWVLDNMKLDTMKIEHLGKEVNTPYSEFNAIHVFQDKIQYSAFRNISADEKNPDYKVRIYNQPTNPTPVFVPNGAQESMHMGNGAYSPDIKQFYFTQCEADGKKAGRCDIYVSTYDDFKWQPAKRLPEQVNSSTASNTHPNIGQDLQGNPVLFFASDRNGGQGGYDIWTSKINADGTYGPAENAGNTINTQGNEITPFYDLNNRKLYFSSDWHYGFAGYDIFETTGEYANWKEPKNLMRPVNSSQNDLYYSLANDNSVAYITSNRKGSYFIEAETCCNDIYAYKTGKTVEKKDTIAAEPKTDTLITQAQIKPEKPTTFIDETKKGEKQRVSVVLYFHNDEPNPKTLSDTTNLDYQETYRAYTRLQQEYEREYAKGLDSLTADSAKNEVKQFFEQKAEQGFENLQAFSKQLLQLLEEGYTVEITIKGYCSPLNFNEYNIHLGNRRVASLRNYFYHYRAEIFMDYIAQKKLVLKNESFGEETAATTISDSRTDTRNSVYSPAAALERRVEIISVEVK